MCQLFFVILIVTVVGDDQTEPKGSARPEVVGNLSFLRKQNTLPARLERDQRVRTKSDLDCFAIKMNIGNENDQVK